MRVLVVEDEAGVALGVRSALEAEGFAVDVAADGHDGWVMAQSGSYDAIVLDLMLPTMNGYKVCAAIREAGDWTPILMLTAKTGEYDIAEGLETGRRRLPHQAVLDGRARRPGEGTRPAPSGRGRTGPHRR